LRGECHHIERICGNQQDRLGRRLHDAANDGLEHLDIAFKQCQPAFTGLLTDTGSDNHHCRAVKIGKFTGSDGHSGGKRRGVGNVLRLGAGQCGVVVNQHDLRADTHQRHRIGARAAHHSGSDDSDFHLFSAPKVVPRTSARITIW